MNVEFCEDSPGTSKKMRYFLKNKLVTRASPGSATETGIKCWPLRNIYDLASRVVSSYKLLPPYAPWTIHGRTTP